MKGKYESTAKKSSKKGIALLLVLFLLVGCVIGTTLAWLTAKVDKVTDTFTIGGVSIDLIKTASGAADSWDGRTSKEHKMVPGDTIEFDPYVSVAADSEACWLFVKVEEGSAVDTCLDYSVITGEGGWTLVNDTDNVYAREVAADDEVQTFGVFTNDIVTVKNVTAQTLTGNYANVKFDISAYAIQSADLKDGEGVAVTTAEAAWAIVWAAYNP